jgi:hypothetical protein
MPEKCLLIMDSFTGQTDDNIYDEVNKRLNSRKKLERMIIPKRATVKVQPLDKCGFEAVKSSEIEFKIMLISKKLT